MAYKCPRCGNNVQRNSAGFFPGGLLGMLIMSAFAGFRCPDCGPIPRSEFTPEERSQMTMGSLAFIGGAILVFVVLIVVIIFFASLGR